ncbi:MAG: hypothetical protein RI947_732 [Candidatus Parcubacteria bacterium]|jgi:O-6-methylguanine DNA methyltransferase
MNKQMTVYWDSVATPRGECVVMATDKGVCWTGTPGTPVEEGVQWVKKHMKMVDVVRDGTFPVLKHTLQQLRDYVGGKRVIFDGPFDLRGTPFQQAVWQEMLRIPYGETKSYGEVAALVGYPKASRAVGGACNANPVAVIVPCHRIVGSNGKLTGYGGGIPTKEWLLKLEKHQ